MTTILILHRGDDGIRGTEVCVINSARALTGAGFRVVVARNHPVMDEHLVEAGATVVDFNYPELVVAPRYVALPLYRWFRQYRSLRRLIGLYAPAVVYCSGGLPCQLAVPATRRVGIPVLCHFHHPAPRRYYRRWLVHRVDAMICPSEYTRRNALEMAGIDADVVYNGVDLQRFRPRGSAPSDLRQSLGIPGDAIVIGQVAQLVEHKRPDVLLEIFARAAARVPRLHLCLVGRGDLEAQLRKRVRQLGLDGSVTITGYVDSVEPYYRDVFDINTLISSEEGLGISIIEGAASGLPAIVTDCTGLRETIVDGKTGVALPLGDDDALADAMVDLALDPAGRRRMGVAARHFAEERFSLASYRRGIVAAVERLLVTN